MMNVLCMAASVLFLTGAAHAADDRRMPTQSTVDRVSNEMQFPKDSVIEDESKRLRPRVNKAIEKADAIKKGGIKIDVPPSPVSMPEYMAKRPDLDLSKMAEYYEQMKAENDPSRLQKPSELLVFVSFSMPPESLKRLIIQTTDAGGSVVFRGPVGGTPGMPMNFKETYRRLGKLQIRQKIDVQINPPAFKQFEIDQVPTFVVSDAVGADKIAENGCAEPNSYLKIAGEVSTEVALRELKKRTNEKKFQDYIDAYLSQLNTIK